MSGFDWSQFYVHMYYLAPLDQVFSRFATSAGMESFFVRRARFTSADGTERAADEFYCPGDTYDFEYVHDFSHGGTILDFEESSLVSFSFGECGVAIRFREVDGATEVALHQTDCPLEDPQRAWMHMNCRSCWIYFMTNLRSILAGGPDVRDFDHPNRNDSISIGWNPTTA
ncbi:MAG: SRPBCC family protein [Acidimicrobiia bacterium]